MFVFSNYSVHMNYYVWWLQSHIQFILYSQLSTELVLAKTIETMTIAATGFATCTWAWAHEHVFLSSLSTDVRTHIKYVLANSQTMDSFPWYVLFMRSCWRCWLILQLSINVPPLSTCNTTAKWHRSLRRPRRSEEFPWSTDRPR